jgi:hypothetical protein
MMKAAPAAGPAAEMAATGEGEREAREPALSKCTRVRIAFLCVRACACATTSGKGGLGWGGGQTLCPGRV